MRLECEENKIAARPIASLSGKDGKTTMTGLVVVAGKDPALEAANLKGYRILFGDPHCDEKSKAPLAFFQELGVAVPKDPETCTSCTDGATKVVDGFKKGEKVAAVISSYAQPLLEGCGTIEKGDLRVVGETEPVPFIVAFANGKLPEGLMAEIQKTLLSMGESKDLLAALETKDGFVALPAKKK